MLGELDPDAVGPGIEFATHYEPTPLPDFDRFLKAIPPDFDIRESTFVDVGSGMGRVVLLASRLPFKQIVGVEISPALHEIARENHASFKDARIGSRDVRLVRADAATYKLPPGKLLVYLYNPFVGELFKRFVARLAQVESDDVLVLYHTPVERESLERTGAFTVVDEFDFGAMYRKKLL